MTNTTTQTPLSQGAALLRAGRTYDYECSRTTNRLQTARRLLAELGIVPTVEHGRHVESFDWATSRSREACTWECKTVWPEKADAATFEAAWRLADAFITARADWMRRR